MNEFQVIKRFFSESAFAAPIDQGANCMQFVPAEYQTDAQFRENFLGIGDDAALLPLSAHQVLAVSTDSLIEDTHFFADMPAEALGYKALAVNLSDLAAMGATPRYFTLALHLPQIDEVWLQAFQQGLRRCAQRYGCGLVGGDTCRSAQGLSINITVMGEVNPQQALRRDRAQVGDGIYVSGCLGASALGLLALQKQLPIQEAWLNAHYYPQPQIALGQALLGVAHAAIDVSDGLLADLGHILQASQVGARLNWQRLPLAPDAGQLAEYQGLQAALTGGEDYQLCFTVPVAHQPAVEKLAKSFTLTRIGDIIAEPGVQFQSPLPAPMQMTAGFQHF